MERNLRPKTDKDFGTPPAGYVAGRGRGATGLASGVSRNVVARLDEDKEVDLGDGNYDEFQGYSGSLFSKGSTTKEDDEADLIFESIDRRMESRRRKARDSNEERKIEELRSQVPDIINEFSDLKRELTNVSTEDWLNIPEAQERLKAKKLKRDSEMNAPDRLIMPTVPALPPGMPPTTANNSRLSAAVGNEGDMGLSSFGVDAEGYLSQLDSTSGISDIQEVQKARLLFRSITKADPSNVNGWLAAARLEEVAGNILQAQEILAQGLSQCPTSEDLWLSTVRLEGNSTKAKSIIAAGIRSNPKSVKLWIEAVKREDIVKNKIRVFHKALEMIPSSVDLWKGLVNASPNTVDSRTYLSRAVECCSDSEELWLAYAKLSDCQAAQKILNDARRAMPTSVGIWLSAAELAETMGADDSAIENILLKAIESLAKNGVILEKSEWLKHAASCASTKTSRAITCVVIRQFIEVSFRSFRTQKEIKHDLYRDVEYCNSLGCVSSKAVSRGILSTAVFRTALSQRKGIWIKLLNEESDDTVSVFEAAVTACPHSEVLWLMFAKHLWGVLKDTGGSRDVLRRAMDAIPDSEDIYVAAARLEETVDIDSTRRLLDFALDKCPNSCRIWIKSAQLERSLRRTDACVEICKKGIGVIMKSPDLYKLWLIACHAYLETDRVNEAQETITKACESLPNRPAVWAVACDVFLRQADHNRARSVLERARVRLPTDEILWYKGYMVEAACHGSDSTACRVLLSRALQSCPSSGILWAYAISTEPVATRHPKCLDALKRCPNHPLVVSAVAKFFWVEKLQFDKARKWFQNALASEGGSYGQVFAEFLAFELSQGDDNIFNLESLIKQISQLDDRQVNKGFEWNQFRKQVDWWSKSFPQTILGFALNLHPNLNDTSSFPRVTLAIESLRSN
jgi:pre-mRNA-processing factor 6